MSGAFNSLRSLALVCTLGTLLSASVLPASAQNNKPTIVLVHGAWADASSWNGVIDILHRDGYTVKAPPNTLRGLAADATVITAYLKFITGPVVLVGHSYGGAVISVASAKAPNVKALVYVDAYGPDAGESIQSETAALQPPPADFAIAVPIANAAGAKELYVRTKYFESIFASAEPPAVARRLAATQRPYAERCITDKAPADLGWKRIPSWYVVGEADRVIPPRLQRSFANRAKSKVYRIAGGDHPSMIAHPRATVSAILDAVSAVSR